MSWRNGRSLTAASSGSTGISFTYDAGGMRTSKTVGTLTSIYFYASGKLLREVRYNSADQTTAVLDFFYAYDGTPYAMKYNGTVYYFLTNLQGDVMMILDASGSLAGGYVYDPYGKVLSATGTIATINPLRYRGYYHDTETGFYYLHSRYYDPEIGRFINADGYASTGQGVIGNNMFAYCNNNPVNYKDLSGNFAISAVAIVVGSGAILGGVNGAFSAAVTGGDVGAGTVKGALTGAAGAAAGVLIPSAITAGLVGLASGFAIDIGVQTVSQYNKNGTVNLSQLNYASAANTGIVTACGAAFPAWGDPLNKVGDALGTSFIWGEVSSLLTGIEFSATNHHNNTTPERYTPEMRKKLTVMERRLDPGTSTSSNTGYSQAMRNKLTVMERRLDP